MKQIQCPNCKGYKTTQKRNTLIKSSFSISGIGTIGWLMLSFTLLFTAPMLFILISAFFPLLLMIGLILIIVWLLSNPNKMKCKTCGYVWEEKE